MATEEQLIAALRKADAAGNTEDAKTLASALKEMRAKDDGFSFGEMLSNVPSSAKAFAGNIWDAITNPKQTLEGVGALGAGTAQLANDQIPGAAIPFTAGSLLGLPIDSPQQDYRGAPNALAGAYKDRYGSVDQALNTLEGDPVGAMADASILASPAAKVAGALNPLSIPGKVVKAGAKALPKDLPARMYERTAKWSTTLDDAERASLTETALAYGLPPSAKGVDKLHSIIRDLNGHIDDLIKTADASGKTVPRSAIYKHLKKLRQESGGLNIDAPANLKAIDRIVGRFEEYAKTALPERLSASQLQKFKKSTYDLINWDAKHLQGTPIREATLKAVARGAKEGVEQVAPNVKEINAALSDLYELQPHLQRVASRLGNRQVIPLSAPGEVGLGTALGAYAGGPTGAAVGGGFGTLAALSGHHRVAPNIALAIRRQQEARLLNLLASQGKASRGLLYAEQADRMNDNRRKSR